MTYGFGNNLYLCSHKRQNEKAMTQLTVKIEDVSMLEQIKQAISLLRGVVSVKEKKAKPKEYDITKTAGFREAMDDIEHGRVTHADSVDDMFQQILGYVPN